MAFNPNSTIHLCNVPIDSTYQHQLRFAGLSEQQNYFANHTRKTFTDYLTIRATRPDGSLKSSIKVGANIDELRSLGINYMYYQNANHGTRYFYAFVNQFVYINEATTEIIYETDVFQTWMFDVQILPSYIVREHSFSDEIGDNVVPEKFNFQDYVYSTLAQPDTLNDWGYLVGCSNDCEGEAGDGTYHQHSGIYQGLHFYYYNDIDSLHSFIQTQNENDAVVFVALMPELALRGSSSDTVSQGLVLMTAGPACEEVTINMDDKSITFGGYIPKNKKLYTSPFCNIVVSNHNGGEAVYNIEDFKDRSQISFKYWADISASPSVTLTPANYKGLSENIDAGISITGFPQCSTVTDTFKLWLAKNQYGVALDTASNIGTILAGIGSLGAASVTGGISGIAGAGMIVHGVQGIMSTINTVYQADKEPNRTNMGSAKNNLLTAMGKNEFDFYCRCIKPQYAITVDNFFTKYGYQTNQVKIPNYRIKPRPYWDYVQTADVNIVGVYGGKGIPSDDMQRLKDVFNKGVTIWNPNIDVGDYTYNNSPS